MIEDIEEFIGRLVDEYGVLKVLFAPLGVIAALGGLGLSSDHSRWAGLVTGAAATTFVVLLVLVGMSMAHTRRVAGKQLAAIERMSQILTRTDPSAFRIKSWHEEATVGKRGNAVVVRRVVIEVTAQELPLCWTGLQRTSPSTLLTKSQQSKVRVEARAVSANGQRGTRFLSSTTWDKDRPRLVAFVFFNEEPSVGDEVPLWMKWTWPGFYAGLLSGETERVEWHPRRRIDELSASITIAGKLMKGRRLVTTPNMGSPEPTVSKNESSGSVTVSVAYRNLQPDQRVGYHLECERNDD